MKTLSALVLSSVLAVAFTQEGYHPDINLQQRILALLTFSNGSLFCSMALITIDRGIAASTCFANTDMNETEIFALSDELFYSPTEKGYRVRDVIIGDSIPDLTDCRLSMVVVERESNLDILSLVKGIFRTYEDFSSMFDGPLLVYGYSEHKIRGSVLDRKACIVNVTGGYYNIHLNEKHDRNLKGAPVFYNRKFLAICENDTNDTFIHCLDARQFSRQVFQQFITNTVSNIRTQVEIIKEGERMPETLILSKINLLFSLGHLLIDLKEARQSL